MENRDFYGLDQDPRESHAGEGGGIGERDYFDHLRALTLSFGERMIVLAVVAFIAGMGFAGYLADAGTSLPVTMAPAAVTDTPSHGQVHLPTHIECDEFSPYAERSC
ncbi:MULTISPECIES: hypothetical protein [unclassified Sinorhizobium]|uniref:hypothetical protein n=1 Tax=unclassified Sinorhizobium TaxID=2613772 RepID=UPI0035265326